MLLNIEQATSSGIGIYGQILLSRNLGKYITIKAGISQDGKKHAIILYGKT